MSDGILAPEPSEPIPFKWEKLDSNTSKAKVIGGWVLLVKTFQANLTFSTPQSMIFIPDPNHEWTVEP